MEERWTPDEERFVFSIAAIQFYRKRGNRTEAVEKFETFLSLWEDADPGIAEVEDAEKRLEEIKSQ